MSISVVYDEAGICNLNFDYPYFKYSLVVLHVRYLQTDFILDSSEVRLSFLIKIGPYTLFIRRMQSLGLYRRLLGPVSEHVLINWVSNGRELHQVVKYSQCNRLNPSDSDC